MKLKFPGLERRKFELPQKFETINNENNENLRKSNTELDIEKQKIGYFSVRPKAEIKDTSYRKYFQQNFLNSKKKFINLLWLISPEMS